MLSNESTGWCSERDHRDCHLPVTRLVLYRVLCLLPNSTICAWHHQRPPSVPLYLGEFGRANMSPVVVNGHRALLRNVEELCTCEAGHDWAWVAPSRGSLTELVKDPVEQIQDNLLYVMRSSRGVKRQKYMSCSWLTIIIVHVELDFVGGSLDPSSNRARRAYRRLAPAVLSRRAQRMVEANLRWSVRERR